MSWSIRAADLVLPLTCSTCTPASHHDINITTYQHTLVLHPFFARLFSQPPWRTPPEATTASLLCFTLGFLVHRTIRFLPFSTTSCLPASHPVTLASLLLPSAIPRLLPLPAAPIPSTLLKIIKYQLTPVYLPLCLFLGPFLGPSSLLITPLLTWTCLIWILLLLEFIFIIEYLFYYHILQRSRLKMLCRFGRTCFIHYRPVAKAVTSTAIRHYRWADKWWLSLKRHDT